MDSVSRYLKIPTSWKVDGLNMKLKGSHRVDMLNNLEPQHVIW